LFVADRWLDVGDEKRSQILFFRSPAMITRISALPLLCFPLERMRLGACVQEGGVTMGSVKWRGRREGTRWACGLVLALTVGGAAAQADSLRAVQSTRASGDTYDRMTGDIIIRHRRIEADGRTARVLVPTSVLHLERQRHHGRWRTALTLRGQESPMAQTLSGPQMLTNPFVVTRFEHDGDGAPPRMYTGSGALIAPPDAAARRALNLPGQLRNQEWQQADDLARSGEPPDVLSDQGPAAGLLIAAEGRALRQLAIERAFGRPVERVSGLDRFVSETSGTLRELFADPATALPVEASIVRAGRLVSRTSFAYQPLSSNEILRRLLRSERVISAHDNTRIVMEIECSNLTFSRAASR
jgi:hypothetical protein